MSDLAPGRLELPEGEIEQEVEDIAFEPLSNHFESIIRNAQVRFRDNPEAEAPTDVPGLVYGDSESDEEQSTAWGRMAKNVLSTDSGPGSLGEIIVGGAVVKNVALVVPENREGGFGDLPVLPITAVGQETTELLAVVGRDPEEGGAMSIPVLLMPDEEEDQEEPRRDSASDNISRLAAASVLANMGKTAAKRKTQAPVKEGLKKEGDGTATEKEGEKKEKEDKGEKGKVAKTEMDRYVLSGDIENLFGIKGLKGKLYKYKGPETKEDKKKKKNKKEGDKKGKEEGEDQSNESDEEEAGPKARAEGKDTLEITADSDKTGKKDEKESKEDKKDKAGKKDKEKKEPAREKVKINPQSLALLGKPLGTLLPFLESEEIKSLPIENLEFTYCEEKSGHFFPPGLRLEVDVSLKGSLQWVTDALQKMFGLELTATKAASKESKGQKTGKDGNNTDKNNEDDKATEEKPTDEQTKMKDDEPKSEVTIKKASTVQVEPAATDSLEEDSSKTSPSKDDKKDNKDQKDKVKKSYNYGFGFFGTVSFIKMPHANAPLDLHIRIGRDFEVEKDEKKDKKEEKKEDGGGGEEKKKKKKKENDSKKEVDTVETTGKSGSDTNKANEDSVPVAKEVLSADSTEDAGGEESLEKPTEGESKPQKPEEKKHSDGRHKRVWSVVIYCDEWKDIYGVKNVSLKKAELRWSFEQGNFGKTMAFDLSAEAKLGAGSFKAKGKFSKLENFVDAEVGDLSLTDFKKIHAQILGQEVPEEKKKEDKEKTAQEVKDDAKRKEEEKKDETEEAKGNEITFKKIHLNLSHNVIEKEHTWKGSLLLAGHVTFNGKASAHALLELSRDGLTISGALTDYQIPDTPVTIQQARMHIFIGFKHGKKNKKLGEDKLNDEKSISEAPSTARKGGNPDQGEGTSITKAGVDSKADEDAKKGVKESDEKGTKKKAKRESEFAILGVVKINEVTVSVGLYIARKNDKAKRDWLAFGSVGNLTLSQLVPELKDSPLNLHLDNIALIASSEDREIKEDDDGKEDKKEEGRKDGKQTERDNKIVDVQPKDKKSNGKTDKTDKTDKKADAEEKKDKKDDEDNEHPEHAGVLETVESYKYPIRKGVQLCATIRSFEALEQLNKNKPIDGLILIIAFTPEGLEISIDLPKTLQVPLDPHAILGDFGATILATEGELELSTTLTLLFDDQRPIRVTGKIKASALGAGGELYMNKNDKWINPFRVNEKVVISQLGVGIGIKYATVWVIGPDTLSIRGAIDVGKDFHAGMVLSGGLKKEQVICIDISEINISRIVQLAGEMTDIVSLQSLNGGEDFLIFRQVKFYMSTGGVALGTRYERGIHVMGKVEFFGKNGGFDGQIHEDGVMIKGAIDNFNIGGLKVQSARTEGERATLDIEMTGDKQKVLIDGAIHFDDFKLSILIDAYLAEKRLEADVSIQFTEHILLHLKANTIVPDSQSLDGLVLNFEAEIRPEVIGAIFEAIDQAIATLGKMASEKLENAEKELQKQIDQKDSELNTMETDLQRLKEDVEKEVRERKAKIDEDSQQRKKLQQKLKKLQLAVEQAEEEQNNNKSEIKKLKAQKEKTEREFDDKIRDKRLEYQREEEAERVKQKEWEMERQRLEKEKEASFGDALRSKEAADANWASWEAKEKRKWEEVTKCEAEASKAWKKWKWGETTYWNGRAAKEKVDLEWIHAKKAAEAEILHAAEWIFSDKLWIDIEKGLTEATGQIEKHARALHHIMNGQLYTAIGVLETDKRETLNREIAAIQNLEEISKEIEGKLRRARQELEKNKGRITKEEKKLQKEIEELRGELKTRPFEDAYKAKLQDHESVTAQIQNIKEKLQEVRTGIDKTTKLARAYVHVLEQGTPTVKRIVVTGSTEVFAKKKPLTFKVEARWNNKPVYIEAQWAPGRSAIDLYEQIGSKIVKAAGEQS
ncbi:hypothetical protein ANOM_002147 [Aspergillus nomiae NRRL 13137]|uniref:Uncharacterized protein n=1 Tax=Aspergillus nomiae NRRL (strain ATCC 15546 / NRRL 13137 / CBS 260.88 / M93) TaxID=1509407 RepID=A0A0L1JBZ5_ASPN3|nr:uncharacterized protein ANOM_002147 [Aspergillus nomiae NRRL 13137]KNG89245.1 hypothetical protein ANOM_002147 [Aspergillus nomiae NRRL 13137]